MAQTKNIDIIPNSAITRVHVSQGDVGRTIYFNLYEGSLAYTPTSGDVIKCVGTKPSGLGFTVACTWSGNVVTCVTTEEMTDESGNIDTELVITSSDESTVLGTSNFVLVVEKNPHTSDTTDGTQTTAQSLQVQIDNLNTRVTTLEGGGSGLTDGAKQALLNCFAHVAWIDEHGQDYYDALEDALYPPANLVSISAVYTQSGTVYDNADLDDLKTDLVVTAHWDDSSTTTVSSSDYTLSGTLSEGTSTITVAYSGFTTTFDVTVTHATVQYSITNTLTNCTNSNSETTINEESSYTATLTADTNYAISEITVTMGGTDVTSTVYSNGTITIASVTGDIVIVATATYDYGWTSGTAYDLAWTSGIRVETSNGTETENSSYTSTDYIPCYGVSGILVEGITTNVGRSYYDENYTFISGTTTFNANTYSNYIIPPRGAYYVRFSTTNALYSDSVAFTPYLFDTLDETTVWNSGQIYELSVGETDTMSALAFCFGATTIDMIIDSALYGLRGYYALYDSAKSRTNSMGNTNNFTRNDITVAETDYYFAISTTTTGFRMLVKLT